MLKMTEIFPTTMTRRAKAVEMEEEELHRPVGGLAAGAVGSAMAKETFVRKATAGDELHFRSRSAGVYLEMMVAQSTRREMLLRGAPDILWALMV